VSDVLTSLLSDQVLQWLALLVVPLLLVSATSFVKISVVFAALRSALGAPDLPSTLVTTALSFVLTVVVMTPVADELQARIAPSWAAAASKGKKPDVGHLWELGTPPMQAFFTKNSDGAERALFVDLANKRGASPQPDALRILWPAFLLTELKEAFQMALMAVLPFLIIDLVLANVLLALGMTALPPAVVGLPFKLLLFVSVDGFAVLSRALIGGYA